MLSYAQTGYPIPQETSNRLFYIQRNHNKNTIVYDANFDDNGNLNLDDPINVYWIRYEEEGQRMDLRTLEKWMVFGVKTKKITDKLEFSVHLSASKKMSFHLKQITPFKAELYTKVDGVNIKLDHIYAELSESGWLPKPKYADFFGTQILNGKIFYKRIDPKNIK